MACRDYKVAAARKGILRSDDALLAVKHGVSGVIVSITRTAVGHHSSDYFSFAGDCHAVAAISKSTLRSIRRGTDMLKAMPALRALSSSDALSMGLTSVPKQGIRYVLEMLRQEFDLAWRFPAAHIELNRTRSMVIEDNGR